MLCLSLYLRLFYHKILVKMNFVTAGILLIYKSFYPILSTFHFKVKKNIVLLLFYSKSRACKLRRSYHYIPQNFPRMCLLLFLPTISLLWIGQTSLIYDWFLFIPRPPTDPKGSPSFFFLIFF